jgi:chromosome segregation ATPase
MTISPELAQAVNHLKTHAHQMNAILVLAEAISSVQDIERLAGEAHAALTKVRADTEEQETLLANIKADVEAERKRRKAEKEKASEGVAAAEAKAKEIIAEAERAAGVKLSNAESERATIIAEGQEIKAEAVREAKEIDATVEIKRAELADLNSEHSALLDRVERAKAYLKKLAGE